MPLVAAINNGDSMDDLLTFTDLGQLIDSIDDAEKHMYIQRISSSMATPVSHDVQDFDFPNGDGM